MDGIRLPNIIFELNLSMLAPVVYMKILGVHQDEIKEYLAIDDHFMNDITHRDVKDSMDELSQSFDLLNGNPLIKITKKFNGKLSKTLEVMDILEINENFFKNRD